MCVKRQEASRVAGDAGLWAIVGGSIKGQSGGFRGRPACSRIGDVGEEHLRTLGILMVAASGWTTDISVNLLLYEVTICGYNVGNLRMCSYSTS